MAAMSTRPCDDEDYVAVAFGGIRPAPKPFPPRDARTGRELCKNFMKPPPHEGCTRESCAHAHVALDARPDCHTFENYGVCTRGDGCWLRHRAIGTRVMDACVQVDGEFVERYVMRLREIFGEKCIVAACRTTLVKNTDALICVRAPRGGAAAVVREICEKEPYGLAKAKRVFVWPNADRFASFVTRDDDDMHKMETWLEDVIDECIEESEATADAPIYVRTRASPKDLADKVEVAMASIFSRRGAAWAARPPGKGVSSRQCTHCIDAVNVWGRAFVGIWETRRAYEDITGRDEAASMHERDAPVLAAPGVATMDDLVQFHLKLQDYRVTVKPVCRAYFKLHEALLRSGVPIRGDWNCVDIGAAPGGWVQVLSSRLAAADDNPSGIVWGIDPAELTLDPLPKNVRHLPVLAEDAVDTVREGLKQTTSGELRLVVCDANMHPGACMRIVLSFATQFASKQESWIVMSTKNFCKRRNDWLAEIQAAKQQCLDAAYDDVFVMHLFSNCFEEKTLFARKLAR